MAEDIRLRSSIEQRSSPTVEASGTIVQPIDSRVVTGPADRFLQAREDAQQKALERAKRIRLADLDNSLEEVNIVHKAAVSDAEGLNAFDAFTKAKNKLSMEQQRLLQKVPQDMQNEARLMAKRKELDFQRLSTAHMLKEGDKHTDTVYKTKANNATQNAVFASPDPEEFETKLNELAQVHIEYGVLKGKDEESVKLAAKQAQSTAILKSIENVGAVLGNHDGAMKLFENYKGRMNPDDQKKAESALVQAKNAQRNTLASALVSEAASLYPENPSKAWDHISKHKDADVAVIARRMYGIDLNFREKQKTREEQQTMAEAYEAVQRSRGNRAVVDSLTKAIPPSKLPEFLRFSAQVAAGAFVATDPQEYNRLYNMGTNVQTEDEFAAMDLRAFSNKISQRDMQNLQQIQLRIRNKNTDQTNAIKYSSSNRVDAIIRETLLARGIKADSDPEEYHSLVAMGRQIYSDVVGELEGKKPFTEIESEFTKRFSVARLPVERAQEGFVRRSIRVLLPRTVEETLLGPESQVITQDVAAERALRGEPILDASKDPVTADKAKNIFQQVNGRPPTDRELQRMMDAMVKEQLRIK